MNCYGFPSKLASVALAFSLLGGCAGFNPFKQPGPTANVVQSSQYCGTAVPDASLHYFATPGAFSEWIQDRDIRGLRAAAASLRGVFVLEMGQRPSAGHELEVREDATITDGTLKISAEWQAPDLDAQVAQVITSPCVVIAPPEGDYQRVVVVDQLGKRRGEVNLP